MTEEVKKEETEQKAPEKEVVVAEPTPHELQAREQGWVSEEEWVESGRDASEWRPAKEFVDRGELYKSIHQTKRELKQTQQALTALQKHHQFVFEKAHQKALAELKAEKRVAIRNEDFERLEAIEEEIDATQEAYVEQKQAQAQVAQEVAVTGPHPDFVDWQQRNSWYATDSDLREFADATGLVYTNKNPGIDPRLVLSHVEKTVRTKFPEKFGARKTAAPNPTASGDRQNTRMGKTKGDDLQLDDMEREIMSTLVKTGTMTEAEYKSELRKVKGL